MIWQVALGLVLMLAGGEGLVRGAVALAERLGVSPLVIGVTLIGFGTSAPELATCIDAALIGAPGIALGNIIGSNIANVLLILAVGALLHPIIARPRALRRDGPVLVAAALIFAATALSGHAGRWLGAALLAALLAYLILTALDDRRQLKKKDGVGPKIAAHPLALPRNLALVAFGLGAILLGADLLVKGAIDLADRLGVSEAVIGLTMVAIGTSLPELATTIIASIKRQGEIAFGNIIGSNIFNIFGIFGATALVQPIDIPADVVRFDIWVMFAATAALLVFAITNWRVSRREGAVLLIGYIAYLGLHAASIGA